MKLTVKTFALSGVALGMFVSVANAADAIVTSSDWTGFSIGVGGGGSFNFANTDAGGFGAFSVSGDSGWMDGGYFFASGSGSGNWGYTDTEDDISGGNTQLWSAAGIGNVPSLINSILAEYNDDLSGSGEGGLGRGGDNDTGKAGFIGTVRGGFDYQLDKIVLGVDAAFNFGQTEINNNATGAAGGEIDIDAGSGSGSEGEGFGEANLSTSLELGNSWSIGGRAGFLATDSTLLFGSAGYVSTKAKLKASFNGRAETETWSDDTSGGYADAGWDIESSSSDWLDGYYIGGGIEQLLTSNISMKLEYRYSDLGSISTDDMSEASDSGSSGGADWVTAVGAESDPVVHSIMATINWRF